MTFPGMHWLPMSTTSRPPRQDTFANRFKEEQAVRIWREKAEQASWIDAGLKGAQGAREVLKGLTKSVTELVLSHNALGDEGVRVLCEGLLDLRRHHGFPGIVDLNLTSNGITDEGFFCVVQYLLLSSKPPKSLPSTLQRLFLSNNKILLAPQGPLPSLLAAALSHPDSNLEFLSLISNENISLDFLRSCTPTSLRALQIDTCHLRDYRPLADFLSHKEGGGRLEQLRANGNYLGTKGVRRLARLVAEGRNTSLTRFELSANSVTNSRVPSDDEGDGDRGRREHRLGLSAASESSSSSSSEGEDPLELDDGVDASSVFMIPGLTKALSRNSVLKEMTQRSCLGFIPYVRVLMLASPKSGPAATEQEFMRSIGDSTASSTRHSGALTMSTEALQRDHEQHSYKPLPGGSHRRHPTTPFPWLQLPMEVRLVVLRHLGQLIEARQVIGLAAIIETRLPKKYKSDRILTQEQFVKLVDFAADRSTLLWNLDRIHTLRAATCERWDAST